MLQKSIASYDGTRIVYKVGGEGERWLVIANGYGGSFWAWTPLLAHLLPRYRVLIWDYRGFYQSGTPEDRTRLRIEDNCRDLERLMEAEGIGRMVLAGWSVGVQVALEHYRRAPETVLALLLINGAHGRVLHHLGGNRLTGGLMPRLVPPWSRAMRLLAPLVMPPLQALSRSPRPLQVFHRLGLVTANPPEMHEGLQAVLTLDWGTYLHMARLADAHDADDMLHTVAVPTLVTAGTRDILTPPSVARDTVSKIPGAEYFEIPGGTHYSPLEFPELLAGKMDSFISAALGPG